MKPITTSCRAGSTMDTSPGQCSSALPQHIPLASLALVFGQPVAHTQAGSHTHSSASHELATANATECEGSTTIPYSPVTARGFRGSGCMTQKCRHCETVEHSGQICEMMHILKFHRSPRLFCFHVADSQSETAVFLVDEVVVVTRSSLLWRTNTSLLPPRSHIITSCGALAPPLRSSAC